MWVTVAILLIVRSEALVQLHTSAVGAIVLGSIHCWVPPLFVAALKGSSIRRQLGRNRTIAIERAILAPGRLRNLSLA